MIVKTYLIIYFYLAKSFKAGNQKSKSIFYFKKVDSIFQIEKDVSPKIRESYEVLINFYKKNHKLKEQLFYVEKLLVFDKITSKNQNYINSTIFKEYDIPKLNSEKESILKKLKSNNITFQKNIIVISIILLITFLFLIYQYNKRKIYKKRFEEILASTTSISISTSTSTLDVPKDIVDDVLTKLSFFEKKNEYLASKITLSLLAKNLETNTTYLSKIINHYRKQSFSNYLNQLRIEYIVIKLKTDAILRKYTITAIAEEAGFNNSESFSKAFYKNKGINPSYFLRELEKLNKNN